MRWFHEPPRTLPDRRETVEIPLAAEGGEPVRLAWREWTHSSAGAGGRDPLPLVLLHGSPGSANDFLRLAPRLAAGRRIVAPDLPGFGASELRVRDYSIRAHGEAVLALLDQLAIERFHLLGFSMGGGAALHIAEAAPDRAASVVLVASIGVQELELLGNHAVNHGLHELQLGLLWGLRHLVPHFGAFDHPVAHSYARNFHDTDQRPLRGILGTVEMPVFIVHGEQDPLVPAGAAIEHHRIVPHSELWMRPDSHFFLFRGGEDLAARIEDFLGRVETGAAAARSDAVPERLRQAALPFDEAAPTPFTGPALLVVVLMLVAAAYVSEDLTCIAAGLLVAQGRLEFPAAVLACYVGTVSSDLAIAWLARVLGRPALRLPPFRWWSSEAAIEDASAWLRRRALVFILASRFVPGARLPTCLAVGILHIGLVRACLYFSLAAAVWTPAFVGANAFLGREVLEHFGSLPGGLFSAALALALFIVLVRSVIVPSFTWRGRRLLRGRLLRLRHWEFWPMWVFYPPLVLNILWIGLRRGRLTAFTAVNPAMPLGGLVGESKSDILDGLAGIGKALPAWRRLAPGSTEERSTALQRFLDDERLDYPVVLKPDAGERGRGVAVVRSGAEAAAFLAATPGPALVQEYVAGEEYGVFWARFPGRQDGYVFSITHKVRPTVSGDGRSTLERLILLDPRAVAIAHIYRREHPDAATRVPAVGETVELTNIGAHSRGTVFLDANYLHTPELEQAMNTICTACEGFDFGRLDLRVPSASALRRGDHIRVLEVNGVTSEAAHMYDPRYGFFAAHAILRRQWTMAFDLATERIRDGARPATLRQILRAVRTERNARRKVRRT